METCTALDPQCIHGDATNLGVLMETETDGAEMLERSCRRRGVNVF